ncbi:MAG: DUF3179 domain-containing protein [Phycisphaerales bacterium]|nr:DUF3179 domain-containing protein [Phycisphaerales bacterium]
MSTTTLETSQASHHPPRGGTPRTRYVLLAIWLIWCFVAALGALWVAEHRRAKPGLGDGRNIDTYGFDLRGCLVPLASIEASGAGRDEIPSPVNPAMIPAAELKPDLRLAGVRKLRSTERVIGVVIDGEPRAYPLWVMVWNEIVNDTVAGRPIAVTYDALCDSAVVFDRAITNEAGQTEVAQFAFSGLLFDSNLLMYDRRDIDGGQSLWSQLQARAIAGPAARRGATLRVLPSTVVTWDTWKARYPESLVMLPDQERKEYFKRDPYMSYLGSDELRFNVQYLPDRSERPFKTPMVAVWRGDGWLVRPATEIRDAIDLAEGDAPVIHSFWFAWYASHPAIK